MSDDQRVVVVVGGLVVEAHPIGVALGQWDEALGGAQDESAILLVCHERPVAVQDVVEVLLALRGRACRIVDETVPTRLRVRGVSFGELGASVAARIRRPRDERPVAVVDVLEVLVDDGRGSWCRILGNRGGDDAQVVDRDDRRALARTHREGRGRPVRGEAYRHPLEVRADLLVGGGRVGRR